MLDMTVTSAVTPYFVYVDHETYRKHLIVLISSRKVCFRREGVINESIKADHKELAMRQQGCSDLGGTAREDEQGAVGWCRGPQQGKGDLKHSLLNTCCSRPRIDFIFRCEMSPIKPVNTDYCQQAHKRKHVTQDI